ncbi:MAG: PEP-CTERM sorting domain-containing protein [Bryobacteraceae bacterium]
MQLPHPEADVRSHYTGLLVFSLMLAAAGGLSADSLHWQGVNAQHTSWVGYYTSPYYAWDTTRDPDLLLTLFCLDFNHEIAPPYDWQADLHPLNQSNVTAYAQFGGNYSAGDIVNPPSFPFTSDSAGGNIFTQAGAGVINGMTVSYVRYLEAAWLFENILKAQARNPADTASMVISQVAVWELFVQAGANYSTLTNKVNATTGTRTFKNYLDNTAYTGTFRGAVDFALIEAQDAVLNHNWDAENWTLVTGNANWVRNSHNNVAVQEFLTPLPVPEPSGAAVLGAVLGMLGLAARRRRNAA